MAPLLLIFLRYSLTILDRLAPRWAGRLGYRLFTTPRSRRPIPSAVEGVMDRAERCPLEVSGKTLAAFRWSRPEAGPGAPVALLVHGWESRAGRLAVWVDPLLDAGFQVVAFDALGHGESPGRRTNPGDFALAIRALAEHWGPIHSLIGHSVGGFSSLLAVAGSPLLRGENLDVRRMVVLAGAESGSAAMGYFCRILGLRPDFRQRMIDAADEDLGHPLAAFDGHRIFRDFPVPTLWLHDPEDPEVPFSGAETISRTCPHIRLQAVEGLGHHRIARDPAVIEMGVAFLSRAAPGAQSSSQEDTRPGLAPGKPGLLLEALGIPMSWEEALSSSEWPAAPRPRKAPVPSGP